MNGALAIIADIHGNRWALDAVLEDIHRRGIPNLVNLGDHFYGPLDPGATAERLLQLPALATIRGNQDRQLIEPLPANPNPTHLYTLAELDSPALDWIRTQPPASSLGPILLCHGSPSSDVEYLLENVTPEGVRPRIPDPLQTLATTILCGHTHIPRLVQSGPQIFVNPGSVGLPAYSDDLPYPHRMETGSPHARYAILDGDRVEHIALAYDFRAAAAAARRNLRPDWACALENGQADPL